MSIVKDSFDGDTHRAGGAGDGADLGVEIGAGEVLGLDLGDLFQLGAGDLADLLFVRTLRALVELDRLLDQHGRRGRLQHEGERLVRVGGDHHRQLQAGFHRGGLRVERLAEFHDVQTALTQRRANRRRRVRLAGRDLQLDEADNLLCHIVSPNRFQRRNR